jgi:hypothetical protein
MGIKTRIALAVVAAASFVSVAQAATLTYESTGGGLFSFDASINQPNGAVPTAFAFDLLGNGAFAPTHTIPHLNDGVYGNSNSWIGNSEGTFAGISFDNTVQIGKVAWGRDNTGHFFDRNLGTYTLQYTTVANPNAATPSGSWTTLGSVTYGPGGDLTVGTALRNVWSFPSVAATGIRLFVPGNDFASFAAIDELEATSKVALVSTGGNFSVPGHPNVALDANGGVAFAKDLLPGHPEHTIPHLNDGIEGNSNSWIGNSINSFGGVRLAGSTLISEIAFGRDNTGFFHDRVQGDWYIEYTNVPNPDASTPDSAWTVLDKLSYLNNTTDSLRHLYSFDAVFATGVRIFAPGTDGNSFGDIDELQVFAVPSPTGLATGLVMIGGLLLRRRAR